jgi:hypothetical protein
MVVHVQEADLPRVLLQDHDHRVKKLVGLQSRHTATADPQCCAAASQLQLVLPVSTQVVGGSVTCLAEEPNA